jgi:glycosyltransferase involved in cell wall biosynthesis
MAGALTGLGHTVHVITSTKHAGQTYRDNGVWVHRIKNRPFRLKELALLNYSYLVAKKVSQINCKFDIVQSSEFGSEAFCFALKKRYPLVTRLATPFFLIEKMNGKVFFGPRPLFNWMEKKQTLFSDGIFTSTHAIAKAVTEEWGIDPSSVQIIPNSVDVSRVIRLGNSKPPPAGLGNEDYILYFGRLEERKGVHVFADALPVVLKRIPNLKVVFAGADCRYRSGSMKEYIKNRSHKYLDRIMFFDNLSHDSLFPIVNSATIVILPSLWEAFGFVCVEAMALGRPVIASSGSGFEEIIEDCISGYLVTPGNSELLAEKIIKSLNDRGALERISARARKRAQDFEVSKIALKLLAYYERTINEWLKKRGN